MSIAPLLTKCLTCWKVWPGQPVRLGQIVKTLSSGLTVGVLQIGHLLRRLRLRRARIRAREFRRDHLGDDVARAHDDDLVADPDVLASEVLLVVEGRGGDRDAADVDRLQHREGNQVTGPADVPDDLLQLRRRRRRRELPGDRPARLAPDHAELPPERPLVDLDHDPVDLIVELVAPLLPPMAALDDRLDPGVMIGVGIDPEAVISQPLHLRRVSRQVEPLDGADPVAPDRERPFGGHLGIELAQGPGGRVARIREGFLPFFGPPFVDRFEVGDREVDLAADFDEGRSDRGSAWVSPRSPADFGSRPRRPPRCHGSRPWRIPRSRR